MRFIYMEIMRFIYMEYSLLCYFYINIYEDIVVLIFKIKNNE